MASLKKRLAAVQTDLVEKDEELKTLSEACEHGATAVKAKEREHKALLEQHKDIGRIELEMVGDVGDVGGWWMKMRMMILILILIVGCFGFFLYD